VTVNDTLKALWQAGKDDRVKVLLLRLGTGAIDLARAEELADAVTTFRRSGKPVIAFAEDFGEGGDANSNYVLATAASQILLQPSGEVHLTGAALQTPFFRSVLDKLGIQVDFSAMPGNIVWRRAGPDRVVVDWRRCPPVPYHPDRDDYQREGRNALRLLEVPITQFSNSVPGMAKRCVWRIGNRCFSMTGLHNKTLKMTDPWPGPPVSRSGVVAFFFHPEELTEAGVSHFVRNVEQLRQLQGVNFVTASQAAESVEEKA